MVVLEKLLAVFECPRPYDLNVIQVLLNIDGRDSTGILCIEARLASHPRKLDRP
jgi:hypothetical protein